MSLDQQQDALPRLHLCQGLLELGECSPLNDCSTGRYGRHKLVFGEWDDIQLLNGVLDALWGSLLDGIQFWPLPIAVFWPLPIGVVDYHVIHQPC